MKNLSTLTLVAALTAIVVNPTWAQSLQLEEIVVVAQKREQSLQDVPISITAYNAETLREAGIDDITDLTTASPSFSINLQQNKVSNSPVRIRGIGTTGTNPAFEGAVGLYVDGVYRSRPGMVLSTFNDIGGLELLKGPQGTLFGKNTSAGALILKSTVPSQESESGVELTVGEYSKVKVSGYFNTPLNDNWSLRVAALSDSRDGYFDDIVNGGTPGDVDTQAIKFQTMYEPSDQLRVRTIIDYSKSDEDCCYGFNGRRFTAAEEAAGVLPGTNAASFGLFNLLATFTGSATYGQGAGQIDQAFSRQVALTQVARDESEDMGISIDASYDISDNMTLRSITSYRDYTNEQNNGDWDFGSVQIAGDYDQLYEIKSFSQEFNLGGAFNIGNSEVEYVGGLFYSNEDMHHIINQSGGEALSEFWAFAFSALPVAPGVSALQAFTGIANPFLVPNNLLGVPGVPFNHTDFDHNDEVLAAFGHFTIGIGENTNLIVGLRHSSEKKKLKRTNLTLKTDNPLELLGNIATFNLGFGLLGGSSGGPSRNFVLDENETTGQLGVQHFLEDGSQLFANYSRGYKAGGIDMNADAGGGTVNLVLAALTGNPFNPLTAGTYAPEFVDSYEVGFKSNYGDGRGRISGAIFKSDFEDLQINRFTGTAFVTTNASTAELLGAELETEYLFNENWRGNLAVTYLNKAEFAQSLADEVFEGNNSLEFAPELAAQIGLIYETSLTNTLDGYVGMRVSYADDHTVDSGGTQIENYTLIGFNLGVRSADGKWDMKIGCSNCTDEDYITNEFFQPLSGPLMVQPAPPRVAEATLRYNFQ